MKFLPRSLDNANLMLLRTYYNSGSKDYKEPDDILDIVYKDLDTGIKHIETIVNPTVDVYIVKPEYRDFDYFKNFIPKDFCTKHRVHYKNRYAEVGKILGCSSYEAKYSKYVYQIDLDVEHFYKIEWLREYENEDIQKNLSVAFSDIESDVITFDTNFHPVGEAPTNAISYLDSETLTMYTLLCIQDNVPHVSEGHHSYKLYEKLRGNFKRQTEEFINDLDSFIEELHEDFDPSYGELEYKIYIFEDEISMFKAYWSLVHHCQNDFIEFWNAPYDVGNLVERPRRLGYDPNELIADPLFREGYKACPNVIWHEDKNYEVHKRKHVFDLYLRTIITDDMVNYAGIRSGKGKLPSNKLNAIAKEELEDEKLDYSEYGNMRYFPYLNWRLFVKYNIKDVLLQWGIDRKVRDTDYIYNLIIGFAIKPQEVFTSTQLVGNDLRAFADFEFSLVMSSNANKLFRVKKTAEELKEEKKKKFAGAFVMNPDHCKSTGFILMGATNKFIHEHVIDEDIGSEYPSGMQIMNCSNDTMVGKVFLVDESQIDVKLYDNMYIIDGDDQVIYDKSSKASNLMVEGLSEKNPLAFGEQFFKLPSFTAIANHIEDNIDDFI